MEIPDEDEMEELDPDDILRAFAEAKRSGGIDAKEGIRIFEAQVDTLIAAHRAAKAKQEQVDKSA